MQWIHAQRAAADAPHAGASSAGHESDDELFELPVRTMSRPPRKTLRELLDETRDFHNAPLPPPVVSQKTDVPDDDSLLEVDLHTGHVAHAPGSPESPKTPLRAPLRSALRGGTPGRGEVVRRVAWQSDVKETTFAARDEKGGPRHQPDDPELIAIRTQTQQNEVLQSFGRLPVDDDESARTGAASVGEEDHAPQSTDSRRAHFESVLSEPLEPANPADSAAHSAAEPRRSGARGGFAGMLGRMVRLPKKLWG